MDTFSHVVKSKSSNSAITSKSTDKKYQKSSGSSFAIQKFNQVKKRGVYVEKKSSKNENKKDRPISARPQSRLQSRPQIRPRPRPPTKSFLSSVLNILSKSTTGTQFPDDPNKCFKTSDTNIKYCHSPKHNSRRAEVAALQMVTKKNFRRRKNTSINKKCKAVKPVSNIDDDKTAVIVLQPKKQIIQTPSNYSEKSYKDMSDPAVWNKLPCLVNYTDSAEYIEENEEFEDNLCTQVCNEAHKKERMDLRKKGVDNFIGVKKSDKALYNFFVDLLQTTISVYNMKPEYENQSKSNVQFEIEEEVANKLDVNRSIPEPVYTDIGKNNNIRLSLSREDLENLLISKHNMTERSFRKIFSPIRSRTTRRKSRKIPSAFNTPSCKPHISRKSRKRRFISLLKKELQMKDDTYEEPQTLFDALKVIAKTKRKEARTVRSNPVNKPTKEGECKFDINRRRNIMMPDRKIKHKKRQGEKSHKNFKKVKSSISRHVHRELEKPIRNTFEIPQKPLKSLEVIGFDYQQSLSNATIPEEEEGSSGSSDSTVTNNKSAFDTEWGDQSSKYQIYNNWINGKGGAPWSDLKSYIFADDDDDEDDD